MDLTSGSLFGRYHLEARLGGGSFGAVWRATDTKSRAKGGKTVALKILSGTYSETEGAQLRTDVELLAAAAAAGSDHVVKVLGGGLEPAPHVVMEYLDGTDLAASLHARGKLPQAEVIAIGEAVADALTALGRVGIIHRDIKPANIMLTAEGGVKLTDFGIAKIVGFDTVTATGQLPLTMAYAAPEVWDGQASGASDLYALGIVLYQCLAGRLPFVGTYSQVYRAHTSKEPDLGLLPADTTPALLSLIRSCLAKDVASRPADPEAALTQLRRAKAELDARQGAAGGHPPVAFGPWKVIAPHPTRAWAWGARNETTGERAIVEVCFGPTAELGETLHRAVEVNPQLVDLGAECLLGTNRVILRPDEAWPAVPPSGPFAFWIAREELPVPPPSPLGEAELSRVVESIDAIQTAAVAAGIRLDLGPTALVTLPDGGIHLRRPGLPPDTTLDPDAAALDSIRRLPLDLALTATVARAPNLETLRRELGVAPPPTGPTMLGVAMTGTGIATKPMPEIERTDIRPAPAQPEPEPASVPVPAAITASTLAPVVAPVQPAVADRGEGRRRGRRIRAALVGGGLIAALVAAMAFGAFMAGGSHSTPTGSGQIAALGVGPSPSGTTVASQAEPSASASDLAVPSGSASGAEASGVLAIATPTATQKATHNPTPTLAPTAVPTPSPAPTPAPTPSLVEFTASGVVVVPTGGATMRVLLVGGGGGGGDNQPSGGGGGGGFIDQSIFVPQGTYNVTVGAGGPRNGNGGNSSFYTLTAIGGGAGGVAGNGNGQSGGSGGGGSNYGQGGSGTPGQGTNGGAGDQTNTGDSPPTAGGGGGAASGGWPGFGSKGGDGGNGKTSNITGTSTTYGGGGGGGAGCAGGGPGIGGSGGGGRGGGNCGNPPQAAAGTPNTGGGGGGGGSSNIGAPGGSGMAILLSTVPLAVVGGPVLAVTPVLPVTYAGWPAEPVAVAPGSVGRRRSSRAEGSRLPTSARGPRWI